MVKYFHIVIVFIVSIGISSVLSAEGNGTAAEIYHDFCSVCHGEGGEGAVWTSAGLDPMPANFTDPKVWLVLQNRDRMIEAVTYGVPQTAMAGWGNRLPTSDISKVVDYVRDTFMQLDLIPQYDEPQMDMASSNPEDHDHDAHGAGDLETPLPRNLKGDLFRGESLYNATCAECHGELGDGKGPRAYFVFPKPRSFLDPASRATYSKAHLFESTAKGILGTEMPAWDKVFGDQDLADVSEYVFEAFIAPNNPLLKMDMNNDHSTHDH